MVGIGFQYALGNLYAGFKGAKDKVYAALCTLPFFTAFVILYFARYSQFWHSHCLLYIFGVGTFLSNVTGYMNLITMTGRRYDRMFWDPFVFFLILYADYNKLFESRMIAYAYLALMVGRMLLYFFLMQSVAAQICNHLQIPFWTIKPVKKE